MFGGVVWGPHLTQHPPDALGGRVVVFGVLGEQFEDPDAAVGAAREDVGEGSAAVYGELEPRDGSGGHGGAWDGSEWVGSVWVGSAWVGVGQFGSDTIYGPQFKALSI